MVNTTTRRGPGRPKGSRATPAVHAASTRCPECQCTRKRAIRIVQERPISGADGKGRPYNLIVWRRVQCVSGGQHRVEIERHYDGDAL